MTDSERESFDNEPLWSERGQVSWLLEQRSSDADLLRATEIASELRIPQPMVTSALEQLQREGQAGSRRVGRSQMWGNAEQMRSLDDAERKAEAAERAQRRRILEDNQQMDQLRRDLDEALTDRSIEVTTLERAFPRYADQPQRDHLLIGISKPEDGAWLLGRLQRPAPDEGKLTEDEWSDLFERLDEILRCLSWAGWESDNDSHWLDYDDEWGPLIGTQLRRTCMAIDVEFQPAAGELRLLRYDDLTGEWPPMFGMLDEDDLVVDITDNLERDRATMHTVAGNAGLLDATHVEVGRSEPGELRKFITYQDIEWLYRPAAAERGIPVEQLLDEIANEQTLSTFIQFMRAISARNVLADCVPDAAARGIAAWCWRNNTAVEAWHLPDDVLMARVNIAVTAAIHPHVDPIDGVDWTGIRAALTDGSLRLPDGRRVADLFKHGWGDVRETVGTQLDDWQHIEEILGSEVTMRLLTIGGSTSYTGHWWGQGRWPTICKRIVTDAVEAIISLPPPYDHEGPDALVAALERPQDLSDDVLHWFIDMPDGGIDGPRGLRFHEVTKPLVRRVDPVLGDEP